MPALINDLNNAFKLAITINGEDRGFSEAYTLVGQTWDAAKLAGKHIAYWRAALLAVDFKLVHAVVSRLGPKKNSDIVIGSPIAGGIGVKFATADGWSVANKKGNSPGVGCRLRFQTADRLHLTRSFRGLPDGMINEFKLFQTVMDQPDLGAYDFPYTLDDAELPLAEYWPDVDSTPPANAASFVTWNVAFQNLARVLFNHTQYGKIVPGVGGANGTLENYPWASVAYRRLSERRTGRPSLR